MFLFQDCEGRCLWLGSRWKVKINQHSLSNVRRKWTALCTLCRWKCEAVTVRLPETIMEEGVWIETKTWTFLSDYEVCVHARLSLWVFVCSHDFIGEFTTSYRELSRGQNQFNVYEVRRDMGGGLLFLIAFVIWNFIIMILIF